MTDKDLDFSCPLVPSHGCNNHNSEATQGTLLTIMSEVILKHACLPYSAGVLWQHIAMV